MNYFLLILSLGASTLTFAQGECLMVYKSHHFVFNSTSDTVWIWVDNKNQKSFPTKGPKAFRIAPNERIEISELAWAEEFRDPTLWFAFKVKTQGLTRLCDSKNWEFERLSTTQGEYSLILSQSDEGKYIIDKNSLLSQELPPIPEPEPVKREREIYDFSDPEAEFPGGAKEMYKWMSRNTKYPQSAIQDSISGRVYIQFIVEETGELSNIAVMRSPNDALSKEAIRLVKSMPKWKPGMISGEAVRIRYNIPVRFNLD
ncbi:MAG: energy transducer TonB [Crocinitomicaceae bacterium]|nr:energy transducer TonB [Crocinitomicaceae bacterium]